MDKGVLHIKKKPRHILFNGKQIPISKEISEIGKEYDKQDCEFEGNPVTKIVIGNVTFSADLEALKAKTEAKQKQAEEEKKRQEEERKKQKQLNQNSSKVKNLYDIENTKLPQDTKAILSNLELIDNYALKLNNTVNFIEDKALLYRKESKNKNKELEKFEIPFDFRILKTLFNFLQTKQQNQLKNLGLAKVENQTLSLDWRLALGLGNASVYETSITLHHIYGIPYIPASSVKGIVRSWVITEILGKGLKPCGEAEAFHESKELCDIFGCPEKIEYKTKDETGKEIKCSKKSYYAEHKSEFGFSEKQGNIIFFDAFPTTIPTVEPDIMNVHYKDYYNESIDKAKTYPTDYQSPNPIPFLTVKGCSFQFIIGVKSSEHLPLLEKAKDWLKKALTQHGIGAKTAVGYGYMQG